MARTDDRSRNGNGAATDSQEYGSGDELDAAFDTGDDHESSDAHSHRTSGGRQASATIGTPLPLPAALPEHPDRTTGVRVAPDADTKPGARQAQRQRGAPSNKGVKRCSIDLPKRQPDEDIFDWIARPDVQPYIAGVSMRRLMDDGSKASAISFKGAPRLSEVLAHERIQPGRYTVYVQRLADDDGTCIANSDRSYFIEAAAKPKAASEPRGGSDEAVRVYREQLDRAQAELRASMEKAERQREESERQMRELRDELTSSKRREEPTASPLDQLERFATVMKAVAPSPVAVESTRVEEARAAGFNSGFEHGRMRGELDAIEKARELAKREVREQHDRLRIAADRIDQAQRDLTRRERKLDVRERELDRKENDLYRRELLVQHGVKAPAAAMQAMPQRTDAGRVPAATSSQRPPSLWDSLGIGNVFGDEGAAGDAMLMAGDDDEIEHSGEASGDDYDGDEPEADDDGDGDDGDDAEGGE